MENFQEGVVRMKEDVEKLGFSQRMEIFIYDCEFLFDHVITCENTDLYEWINLQLDHFKDLRIHNELTDREAFLLALGQANGMIAERIRNVKLEGE